jgi:FixJ family two-component response regulator
MAENKRIDLIDDDEPVRESLPGLVGGVGLAIRWFSSARQSLASGPIGYAGCLLPDIACLT